MKFRITEVTVISNFITNIIRFSENANLLYRNFTAKEVLIRKKRLFLENFYNNGHFAIKSSIWYHKNLEIFFLPFIISIMLVGKLSRLLWLYSNVSVIIVLAHNLICLGISNRPIIHIRRIRMVIHGTWFISVQSSCFIKIL